MLLCVSSFFLQVTEADEEAEEAHREVVVAHLGVEEAGVVPLVEVRCCSVEDRLAREH